MQTFSFERLCCLQIRTENRTLLTFFRHQRSASSTTPHVQGGHQNGAPSQAINSRESSPEPGHKQSQSHKKESVGKTDWRKTSKKNANTERDEPLNGDRTDNQRREGRRFVIYIGGKHFTFTQATKSKDNTACNRNNEVDRARQSTLATALGNPIPINAIQATSATGSNHFEIDSPPENSKQDTPSLKSLLQEIDFSGKTLEYKACVQFIQAISPKHKTSTINDVVD